MKINIRQIYGNWDLGYALANIRYPVNLLVTTNMVVQLFTRPDQSQVRRFIS